MSRELFDFLADSPLFGDLEALAASPVAMQAELERYCAHATKVLPAILESLARQADQLNVLLETSQRLDPPLPLLKRAVLYYDAVILDDPLFRSLPDNNPISVLASKHLGYQTPSLNPQEVVKAANFMQALTPLVAAGIVHFVPLTGLRSANREIAFRLSSTLFAEGIPPTLIDWFHQKVKVHSLKPRLSEPGWYVREGAPLEPARGIIVEFSEHTEFDVYHLSDVDHISFDEATRKLKYRQTFPDTPPDPKLFATWVTQSINQSAQKLLSTIISDLEIAEAAGSLFATTSPFIAELLSKNIAEPSLDAEVATLSAKLDLPILEDVSIENLARIRSQEDEAFQRFRLLLSSKLRDLRLVGDEDQLAAKLKDLQHELTEIRVQELDLQLNKLKKDISITASVALASFSAVVASGGITLPSAAITGGVIVNGIYKLRSDLRQNPAFFLWHLLRKGADA